MDQRYRNRGQICSIVLGARTLIQWRVTPRGGLNNNMCEHVIYLLIINSVHSFICCLLTKYDQLSFGLRVTAYKYK